MKRISAVILFISVFCVSVSLKLYFHALPMREEIFSSFAPEKNTGQHSRKPNQVANSTVQLIDENLAGRKIKLISYSSNKAFFAPDSRLLESVHSHWIEPKWKIVDQTTFKPKNSINENEPRLYDLDRYSVVSTTTPSHFRLFQAENPMVLFDPLKKQFGLLTGTVIVKYSDESFVEDVEKLKNIEMIYHAAHLKVVHLKSVGTVNLDEWTRGLSAIHGFEKMEFEILRANYSKN